jgi:hypothetical protein
MTPIATQTRHSLSTSMMMSRGFRIDAILAWLAAELQQFRSGEQKGSEKERRLVIIGNEFRK